jgi:hypothetical protein
MPGGDGMNADEEFALDMITRFGMPRTLSYYKALLVYAFSSGQVHRSAQSQESVDAAFRKLDAARAIV